MAIDIVDLPSYKMVIFHSYVSLPKGKYESGWWLTHSSEKYVSQLGLLFSING
jgi:hypothetical protein